MILIPEEDHLVNDLGIKGLSELGNVGTNAAVANAVYHPTGVRIGELPIQLEKMLYCGGCDPTLLALEEADCASASLVWPGWRAVLMMKDREGQLFGVANC